jgi:S-adenosylmethionine uptake transporter
MSPAQQVFWILLSCLLFALTGMFIKLASTQFSLAEVLFFRTFPAVLVLVAFARLRGLTLGTSLWRLHLVRGAAGMASVGLAFYAVRQLSLPTATSLEYTAPIFMVLYVIAVRHRRPQPTELFAIFGGFAGVLLLLRPTVGAGQLVPFLLGLGSGALAAVAYFQIRRLGAAGEAPWRIVLIYALLTMLVSLVGIVFTPHATYTAEGLGVLFGVSAAGLLAQLAMTRAFSQGSPTLLGTLQYSTLIFATLFGYWVWGDVLTWTSAAGLVLIVVSGSAAALAARREGPPT